ncbi:MAG: pilus assembly protein, partial [Nevskia sp.]|nr:pilus assembly protein [Nevskia sp.]
QARRSRGQAAVEYLYVIPILLILLFGAIQFTFIYEAKLTLNEAVFTGTRQGALNNGSMAAIQDGLEAGLTPLFTHGVNLQALKDGRTAAHQLLSGTTPQLATTWIVNPNSAALSGFAQTQYDGSSAIPNDNLMYRDPTALNGGMNVQDANLLKVRVSICYPMVVPIINRIIYTVVSGLPTTPVLIDSSSYGGQSIAAPELLKSGINGTATGPNCPVPDTTDANGTVHNYSITITSEAVVRMQSPFADPGSWSFP